jgi:hypothetical protein
MILARALWEEWEARYVASQPPDFHRNLQLLEGMYELARTLGVFPLTDPLAGLETDIRVAKVLNVPTASGNHRTEP